MLKWIPFEEQCLRFENAPSNRASYLANCAVGKAFSSPESAGCAVCKDEYMLEKTTEECIKTSTEGCWEAYNGACRSCRAWNGYFANFYDQSDPRWPVICSKIQEKSEETSDFIKVMLYVILFSIFLVIGLLLALFFWKNRFYRSNGPSERTRSSPSNNLQMGSLAARRVVASNDSNRSNNSSLGARRLNLPHSNKPYSKTNEENKKLKRKNRDQQAEIQRLKREIDDQKAELKRQAKRRRNKENRSLRNNDKNEFEKVRKHISRKIEEVRVNNRALPRLPPSQYRVEVGVKVYLKIQDAGVEGKRNWEGIFIPRNNLCTYWRHGYGRGVRNAQFD